MSHLAISASASIATIDAIQGNISTLLAAQEAMQADIAALREENSSLCSIVNALSIDVEKREV